MISRVYVLHHGCRLRHAAVSALAVLFPCQRVDDAKCGRTYPIKCAIAVECVSIAVDYAEKLLAQFHMAPNALRTDDVAPTVDENFSYRLWLSKRTTNLIWKSGPSQFFSPNVTSPSVEQLIIGERVK